jgi:T5SS/PEP-CTERM-associated repeat protein
MLVEVTRGPVGAERTGFHGVVGQPSVNRPKRPRHIMVELRRRASGALTIQNGSRLTSTGSSRIAIVAGKTGTVTVTGSGSMWNVPISTFYVGFSGIGTLNIENGGQVATGPSTVFGGNIGASSTLNINSGGTLQTLSLRGGDGASQANFSDGIARDCH